MKGWSAACVARAAGASVRSTGTVLPDAELGPRGATIDSRLLTPGELFVGLRGERMDGGAYAAEALGGGAWGVLVRPEFARSASAAAQGVVLEHQDPLKALQALARAWRRELGARVIAITGSTGKTSTKDILAALLGSQLRVVASPENLNTEIGLPLAVLAAPSDTEVLVLEMAMRGPGQIAELTAIAEPDVGVIVNVGPVHLAQLGSIEAIAAAKAELIEGLASGATIVIPVGDSLLEPHRRADLRTITFGEGGDVVLEQAPPSRAGIAGKAVGGEGVSGGGVGGENLGEGSAGEEVVIRHGVDRIALRPSFAQSHNLRNLLAAVAAARGLGVTPAGKVQVSFSALRGERIALAEGIVLINDCYNANPMSMRAAIDDLVNTATGRRVAVLGDMLELGTEEERLHREIGEYADVNGVQVLLTVGPLAVRMGDGFTGEVHAVADAIAASELLGGLLRSGDTVLVKGSRGVGLERVAESLSQGLVSVSAGGH